MTEKPTAPRKPPLRKLRAEEIELWLAVTRDVAPRPGIRLPEAAEVPTGAQMPASGGIGNQPKEPGAKRANSAKGRGLLPPFAPLERRLRQKLARGRAAPEAAIDLHGMRCEEAFIALRRFLARAQADGARLVLIVTGKGERAGAGATTGILRRNVPHWLRSPDFHAIVAGFEEAARPHGGAGALYVKLRRRDHALRRTQLP